MLIYYYLQANISYNVNKTKTLLPVADNPDVLNGTNTITDSENEAWGVGFIAAEWISVIALNIFSALLSGLVLGLLSLDITDLEVLRKCGSEQERRYAASIIPMRKLSNLLLCSLTLANVITNAFLQFILEHLFPGIVGFVSTTACITIFGEIVPQAVCSRYGLAIGARTIWLTWIVIILTFPISWPLSKVLDYCLGEEIAFVYDRERLQEYIRITRSYNNFDAQEINIITGALKIKKVCVNHVMTKIKDVFMLDMSTIITYHVILNIVKKGFSRIPVYDKHRNNIVGLLLIKDLALVNPFSEVTLKSLINFYKHPIMAVDENHCLDVVFNHFREGKSHMALVREHKKHDIVGIVTLEDIIEEVLQVEINDETDVVTDNREMKLRPDAQIPNNLELLQVHLHDAMDKRRAKQKHADLKGAYSPIANGFGNYQQDKAIGSPIGQTNMSEKSMQRVARLQNQIKDIINKEHTIQKQPVINLTVQKSLLMHHKDRVAQQQANQMVKIATKNRKKPGNSASKDKE